VLGLLGPNGAGKTTCVRIITTLLRPDAGRCQVNGIDVLEHPGEVRKIIGLSGQYAAVDEYLTVRENLEMIGRLNHLGKRTETQVAKGILSQVCAGPASVSPDSHMVHAPITRGAWALVEVVRRLDAAGIEPVDIGISRASLDDVFLKLTGTTADVIEEERV